MFQLLLSLGNLDCQRMERNWKAGEALTRLCKEVQKSITAPIPCALKRINQNCPLAVLNPSATLFLFRSYLSFGPAHLFQHLLAKFGVIVAPSAVPWIHRPLLLFPGCSRKRKFKWASLAFPESSWYWISPNKAPYCRKKYPRTYARPHIFWGLILLNEKTQQQQ